MRGAFWRQEQAARLSVREAWHVAVLSRAKKLPSLRSLLREPPPRVERQTPEEQRAFFYDFARRAGLKVERHEKPVI